MRLCSNSKNSYLLFIISYVIHQVFATTFSQSKLQRVDNTSNINFLVNNNSSKINYINGINKQKKFKHLDDSGKAKPNIFFKNSTTMDLPPSFDARINWPNCTNIGHVFDQNSCGSSWALATTSAISDRICIVYNQYLNVFISANDLIACCDDCGDKCEGGSPEKAFDYWVKQGIVTGGDFRDNSTCLPYPFPKCAHYYGTKYPQCPEKCNNPACVHECNSDYKVKYEDDKYYGQKYYHVNQKVEDIMAEIYQFGPVVATFTMCNDFQLYREGIYTYMYGLFSTNHSVKLIGWGVENNQSYWLAVNSWNEEWGEEGLFRISKGDNECNFESHILAAQPA